MLYHFICLCCSVNGSVCLVCELFGETIRNVVGCGCCFVAECYVCVWCGLRCSVGETVYGLPHNGRGVPVIAMCF